MPSPSGKPTRRTALAAIGSLPVAANFAPAQPAQPPPFVPHVNQIPVRGKAGPGLEPLDNSVIEIMERHGIPGAALAIAKDGRLVYARSFGWANTGSGSIAQPETMFGLASLSKSITAVAALKLVEDGKLGLDDKVFDRIKHIKPPAKAKVDPRLAGITVRQCLNHTGGWDRTKSGDPVCWEPQICRAMKIAPPVLPQTFVSFMMGVPLDFDPGTDAKYSNVGYIVMGEVIAAVSGKRYWDFVAERVFKPMGLESARLQPRDGVYPARTAHRHLAGTLTPLPSLRLPMIEAAGGWIASAVDVARYLTNLDGSRGDCILSEKSRESMLAPPPAPLKPRADGTYFGLGWDTVAVQGKSFGYFKDGCTEGMRTYMKRLANGLNWVLLFNATLNIDDIDMQIASAAVREIRKEVEGLKKHPDVDLFKEF